jgi:hypothetical protein
MPIMGFSRRKSMQGNPFAGGGADRLPERGCFQQVRPSILKPEPARLGLKPGAYPAGLADAGSAWRPDWPDWAGRMGGFSRWLSRLPGEAGFAPTQVSTT